MASILRRTMKSFAKLTSRRTKPHHARSKAEPPSEPLLGCGGLDDQENGWLRMDRGELVGGFPIAAVDTVVDVGCGEGLASEFAAGTGAEVIAIDIDPKSIRVVAKKLRNSRARSHQAIVSDSYPLPLNDATASRVVAMEVLEHVKDPARFLEELVRIGRPGALYLITVPDEKAELIQKKIAPPAYWKEPNHLRIFSRDELDRLVTEAGLTIEKRTYKSFFWAMWWILFWAADQDFGAPEKPILANWTRTWQELMKTPKGKSVRAALDEFMPKSQVVIARKPG